MSLRDLQQIAMLAAARVGVEAYGAPIREERAQVGGRHVSLPTVYVPLMRLEEQGLVISTEMPRTGGRGGHPRRVFQLIPAGWNALHEARSSMSRMWDGVARS